MSDRPGQLHFVVKQTRLGVVRDIAVIVLCAVILAIIAVDLARGAPPQARVPVGARTSG